MKKILEKLKKPTDKSEIKYRVGTVYDKQNGKATILSYVDARYVQDILDDVVGPENWENRFYEAKGALFCEISINLGDYKISKSDCGTESDIAPAKGEASDAFKRAAVMFGIGRDLYSCETLFADLDNKGTYKDKFGKQQIKWALPRDWRPNTKQVTKVVKPKSTPKQTMKVDDKLSISVEDIKEKFDGVEVKNLVNFGKKHNGKEWKDVPDDYVNWCSGQDGGSGSSVPWQKQAGLDEWNRRNGSVPDRPNRASGGMSEVALEEVDEFDGLPE